jgi:hypothetical protein
MKPFVVFFVCAAIAGYAAAMLINRPGQGISPEWAGFLLVFSGLAALALPILIAIQGKRKE